MTAALLVGGLLITGCGPGDSPGDAAESDALTSLPEFSSVDHDARPFGSEDLKDKVWVASFIEIQCGNPCDAVTANMTRLQNEFFNHPQRDDFRLLTFGLDPVSDTAFGLAAYARDKAYAYEDRWRFLAADVEASKELFEALGINPEATSESDVPADGAEYIYLVDRQGQLVGRWDGGSDEQVEALSERLDQVLDGDVSRPDAAGPAATGSDTASVAPHLPSVPFPPDALNPPWLKPRQAQQSAAFHDFEVRHDFTFADRRVESGITFLNRVVDDAGRNYKGVHYDHGNGLATADIDGDGWYDLYFTNQLGRNELWRNLGDGRYEDVTLSAGVGLGERISVTASFADIDNDADPDLFVTTVRDGNVLFLNDGKGRFSNISSAAGVDHVGHSSGAVFFDFNRDGLLDLFVTNIGQYTGDERGRGGYWVGFEDAFAGHLHDDRTETSILYKNLGDGKFEDVTEAMNIVDGSWSGDASPFDVDDDGWPDLYLLDMQGDDEVYRNVEGERFEKISRQVLPVTPWGSMGIKVFDIDNDQRMDIFLSDMHSDMSQRVGPEREELKSRMQWSEQALGHGGHHSQGDDGPSLFGNALFRATDSGYEEVSEALGSENYWPWGLSTGDLNADGWEDVLLTSSMNYPWRYGLNNLLLNDRGQAFRDAEFVLGIEPRFVAGRTVIPWFELDCTGDLSRHPTYPEICRGHSGRIMVEGALGSRSAVIQDIDGDGDLDIVTAEFNYYPQVLLSNLAAAGDLKFVELVFEGRSSNRDGLGAKVTVRAGDLVQTKVHDGKSGYLSQSSQPLYFGLGSHSSIDSITVQWPSGTTQELQSLAVGERHVIQEP